jgi:hypothetical protein
MNADAKGYAVRRLVTDRQTDRRAAHFDLCCYVPPLNVLQCLVAAPDLNVLRYFMALLVSVYFFTRSQKFKCVTHCCEGLLVYVQDIHKTMVRFQ